MKRSSIYLIGALAIGFVWTGCGSVSTIALAKSPKQSNSNNNYNNNNNNNQGNSNSNNAAIDAAQSLVNSDLVEVNKDQSELEKIARPLRAAAANSPDLAAATAALHDAEVANKAAEAAVTTALQTDPAFQTATKKKTVAEGQLKSLKDAGASPDDLVPAATAVMDAGGIVTKMKADALRADPKVVQTHADLVAAEAKVTELKQAAVDVVRNDPGWIAAKKTLDEANTKLANDRISLASARGQ